jgi:ribosome biogenesis protein UTP30
MCHCAPSFHQVVGLSKLRTKYESHEAKRQLCDSYDLFLADERIVPSLPKLIGGVGL